MSSMRTYAGVMFDPLHPDKENIDIRDIAHALSLMCRANGHFRNFYSVAQHSLNCMAEARAKGCNMRIQLACLLHDASEAYLSDITRPVKKELPRYLKIEAPLQEAIWEKYLGEVLTDEERRIVFEIDDTVLWYEFDELMGTKLSDIKPEIHIQPELGFRDFKEVEEEFIRKVKELTNQ